MKLRLLAALGILLTVGVAMPSAQATDVTLKPKVEAWFQPDPTCALPTGCLLNQLPALPVPLAADPYPAGTLHVGYTAQKESQRAYLAFGFGDLGFLTKARLDVPLSTSVTDGSISPETAKVQVCLVTEDITTASGSTATPPTITCDTHVDLTYVATPAPHLTGDLAPIMAGLPTTSGIVLLPASTVTATDTWQVAFSAHDRTGDGATPPATLTVSDGDEAPAEESPSPESSPSPAKSTHVTVPSTQPVTVPPVITGPTVTLPDVPVPSAAPASEAAPEVAPTTEPDVAAPVAAVSAGSFKYPLALLLPLSLLLIVPSAARALTRDLDEEETLT